MAVEPEWCPCGKRRYRSWRHAANDARSASWRSHEPHKPYWSRDCQCIHVAHARPRRRGR